MADVVDLGFRDNMPVRFGSDFNLGDACVNGFNKTYCQPVQEGDETKFQVAVDERIGEQVPVQGDWTVGPNWVANADGSITHSAGSTAQVGLITFVTSGDIYRLIFTISSRTAGSFTIAVGGVSHTYSANILPAVLPLTVQTTLYILDTNKSGLPKVPIV